MFSYLLVAIAVVLSSLGAVWVSRHFAEGEAATGPTDDHHFFPKDDTVELDEDDQFDHADGYLAELHRRG